MMVVVRTSHLSQPSEPTTNDVATSWDEIDAEFSSIIGPVHLRLCSGETKPAEAADTFAILLRAHLEHFLGGESPTSNRSILHHSTTEQSYDYTNNLRRQERAFRETLGVLRKEHVRAPQLILSPTECRQSLQSLRKCHQ